MKRFNARIKEKGIKFDRVYERQDFIDSIEDGDHVEIIVSKKGDRRRTGKQNNSIHVYFQEISQMLNESGISVPIFLEHFEIDFTSDLIKRLWQKIGKKKFDKEHTSDWTVNEIPEVYEEFNRQTSLHGLHIPFPSLEEQIKEIDSNNTIDYPINNLKDNNI